MNHASRYSDMWMRREGTFMRYCSVKMIILGMFVLYFCHIVCISEAADRYYTNEFAVKVIGGSSAANSLAQKYGFVNHGQIGNLKGYYLFEHHGIKKRSLEYSHHHHGLLKNDPSVFWIEQQHIKQRRKRDGISDRSTFHYKNVPDPLYREQWYLDRQGQGGYDMNVKPAWQEGVSGKGIVVTILDDGIQTNHPDLEQNYDPKASTDINDRDPDPMPQNNGENKHGTRCAGEVAATAFNKFCGVGIAFNASIGGVRMLDGVVTDEVEARALSLNPNHIDIYSASWGPEDDGKTVDGPGRLAKQAFIQGISGGRRGLGSIFVWASGNGGRYSDNCNCDGYTNSIYTLSISSATQGGLKPWYLEECSSTLATTYSSGTPGRDRSVVTVDMDVTYLENVKNHRKPNPYSLCTRSHTGTSASAPIAAAICALALEANPYLTWRDMQHLVVLTSRPEPLLDEVGWQTNAVGRKVSHKFGYGLMDAAAMVKLAKQWTTVGKQHVCYTPADNTERVISDTHGEQLEVGMFTDACSGTSNVVRYLEHVQVQISLYFVPRGNLHIKLISPSGTSSSVLLPRPRDKDEGSLNNWPLLSVHYWGESAAGKWKLIIINEGSHRSPIPGRLQKWSLILYGTDKPPQVHSSDLRSHRYSSLIRETSENNANPCFMNHTFLNVDSGKCIEECPEGQFPNNTDHVCSFCNFPCSNCYGPHIDNCLLCVESYYLQEDLCVEDCFDGYYKDEETHDCLPCRSQCAICKNNPSFCLSCKSGLYLSENQCQPECPLHTYNSLNQSCLICHPTCDTCHGPSNNDCTSCSDSLSFHRGKCIRKCPEHSYLDVQRKACIECDTGCKTCSQHNCLLCDAGWELEDGYCKKECTSVNQGCLLGSQCHETCKQCSGPESTSCIQCGFPRYLYFGQCVTTCPDGYFGNEHQHCQLCPDSCLKCSGSDIGQCESCTKEFVLHGGNCLPDCPKGWYKTRGKCEQCDRSCATCLDGTRKNCTTCENDRHLISGMCHAGTNCPDGYYLRELQGGKECLHCHHSCQTCNGPGPTLCTSCRVNATFRKGICISCLEDEYFSQDTKSCEHCHPNCGKCYGAAENQCQSCLSPLRLNIDYHRCLPCCEIGVPKSGECCVCKLNSDMCANSDDHPRSIHNIQKVTDNIPSSDQQTTRYTTFIILSICGTAVALYIIVFALLHAKSSGWCQHALWHRRYKLVPGEQTATFDNKMEKVLLTEHDADEDEDDIYCRT